MHASPLQSIKEPQFIVSRLISPTLIFSCDLISSELTEPGLVAASLNWIVCCEATQFTVAASLRSPTVQCVQLNWGQLRWGQVRWDDTETSDNVHATGPHCISETYLWQLVVDAAAAVVRDCRRLGVILLFTQHIARVIASHLQRHLITWPMAVDLQQSVGHRLCPAVSSTTRRTLVKFVESHHIIQLYRVLANKTDNKVRFFHSKLISR